MRAVGEQSRLKSNKSQTQRRLVPCVLGLRLVQDSTRLGLRGENWAKKPLRCDLEPENRAAHTQLKKRRSDDE